MKGRVGETAVVYIAHCVLLSEAARLHLPKTAAEPISLKKCHDLGTDSKWEFTCLFFRRIQTDDETVPTAQSFTALAIM